MGRGSCAPLRRENGRCHEATMPMKPTPVEQCVTEGLNALTKNHATRLPGRLNRIMNVVIPTSLSRTMMGKMLAKTLVDRARQAAI